MFQTFEETVRDRTNISDEEQKQKCREGLVIAAHKGLATVLFKHFIYATKNATRITDFRMELESDFCQIHEAGIEPATAGRDCRHTRNTPRSAFPSALKK